MAVLVHPGLVHPAKAESTSGTWVNTYSSGSAAFSEPGGATAIQQTDDGGFILVGQTVLPAGNDNAWVLRLDSAGSVVWENAYGGTKDDRASSVQQTSDGGFIVAGSTSSFGSGSENAWLLRLDSEGNVIWENAYGGSRSDFANLVQQTSDGGFVVVGGTTSFGAGRLDAWVLRLDSDGNVMWENAYGGTSNDAANSVRQISDGGFIVAGNTHSFGTVSRGWILRLDENGNVVWENAYGLAQQSSTATDVQETSDGRFIVSGWAFGNTPNFPSGAWVFLLDGDGNIEWQHLYTNNGLQGPCIDFANSVQETVDGGFVLATGCDATILRLDSDGNIVWVNQYSAGANTFTADTVRLTSDGGFVVAGAIFTTAGPDQAWVAKLDSDGQVGSNCSFITSLSGTTQSDSSAVVTPTSSTVTDTSSLDTITSTSSTITDTSSTDTVSLICQD